MPEDRAGDRLAFRRKQLESLGAAPAEVAELLAYNENVFDQNLLTKTKLPLADEPLVVAWRTYAEQANQIGAWRVLREKLVQLRFPIQAGISSSAEYLAATRRGLLPEGMPADAGLQLAEPDKLTLTLCPSAAGHIPVLATECRDDFVALVLALAYRNEPRPIPDSMGASIITGLTNWDRVRQYRQTWEAKVGDHVSRDAIAERASANRQASEAQAADSANAAAWKAEFQHFAMRKELYQDRLMVLSGGPYSGVPAAQMQCEEREWLDISLWLRREHECTHYFTRRVLGSMRNNLLDEIVADYAAITAVLGHFKADWLLAFMGLELPGEVRPGGRVLNYLGDPPLSARATRVVQELVRLAALNLERLNTRLPDLSFAPARWRVVQGLCRQTLEELASDEFVGTFEWPRHSCLG